MKKLTKLLFSQTSKDSSYLLLGNMLSTVINFILTLILTRQLTPAEFGLFITGLTVILLVTDFFELGINTALLQYLPKSSQQGKYFISSSFIVKAVTALLVGGIVFIFSDFWARVIFENKEIEPLLRISSLGIILLMFIFWIQAVLQSKKRFLLSSVVNTLINVLRLFGFVILLILGTFNLQTSFIISHVLLLLIVGFGMLLIGKDIRYKFISREYIIKTLRFGLPVGAGFALAAVYTKLDQLFILRWSGAEEAGLYGLANRLVLPVSLVATSLMSAATPRFSELDNSAYVKYFKKVLLIMTGISSLTFIGIIIAPILVPMIFGDEFQRAVPSLQILAFGMILFALGSPFQTAVIYRYSGNRYYFITSGISFALLFLLLYLFVPQFGSIGAAISVTTVYIVQIVLNVLFCYWRRF